MHDYLVPYVGTGTDRDPFRPDVEPGSPWAAIDVRPDVTRRDGWGLVTVPERMDRPQRRYLGDDPEARSAVARRAIGSTLGITLEAQTLNTGLAELLIAHARTDGTRWRPLQPSGLCYEIWLGGLRWRRPVFSGGAALYESFDTTDGTTLGPNISWTEINSDLVISGNRATPNAGGTSCEGRADVDLGNADHSAQLRLAVWPGAPVANEHRTGVLLRCHATDRTHYGCIASRVPNTNQAYHYRRVTGTFTQIGSGTTTAWVSGDVVGGSISGSTLRTFRNGATVVGPATDANITTNQRTGFIMLWASGQTQPFADDFSALSAGGAVSTTFTATPYSFLKSSRREWISRAVPVPLPTLVQVGMPPFRGAWRGPFRGMH